MSKTIVRYGYIDTQSEAGQPTRVELDPDDIGLVCRWVNSYGNPSYVFHLEHSTLLLVDDYGALNDVDARVLTCLRRKDMF